MRRRADYPKPTGAELEILNVLWRAGSATVREVHDALPRTDKVAYTTVLKLLQIMAEKGLVSREEKGKAHVYRPAVERERTQGKLVRDLVDRVFAGSAAQLVLRALSEKPATAQELAEIRRILDEAEKGTRK